ncbi:hypothetical protein [Haloferula rosea]|uniref:Uncharacterized protein n=1 Tax=Haloferula rosea TaxID=490093 RepID=A0A934RAN9_9BACT|nr:hypothetical protein [Haloferula rosea]MBK1827035.1 hypothetical protein [Haloferula rosea]
MRPLPTNPEPLQTSRPEGKRIGSARTLELGPTAPATNQRRNSCASQKAYPWLLLTSTAMAAVFCGLYITKPVIQAAPLPPIGFAVEPQQPAAKEADAPEKIAAVPADTLPGDSINRPAAVEPQALTTSSVSGFEETNLRIQHVLGATGPAGEDLGRITLEVPVLYQSGGIRWTREDVSKARSLLARIDEYQLKSRELRDEAVHLISEWDALIIKSIPESTLRADSPTLPENQGVGTATNAPLKSTEAIEIDAR